MVISIETSDGLLSSIMNIFHPIQWHDIILHQCIYISLPRVYVQLKPHTFLVKGKSRDYVYIIWQYKVLDIEYLFQSTIISDDKKRKKNNRQNVGNA